ncbi:MAG TPA: KH domain-containing protein [Patescibacteria group bacterium]|nr:KH domain-containing protein [Patescibacteria group bacterium]
MKDLLDFMLKGILGKEKFDVVETEDAGRVIYTINTDPKNIGLIIGKGGHMIKALRNVLKIRATLEKKAVALNVGEPQVN